MRTTSAPVAGVAASMLLACLVGTIRGANIHEPHPHTGVLTPYVNGPMKIDLSSADLKRVAAPSPECARARCPP